MPLTQGQMVNNRYRIVRLLGQGGFGAVYQAWDINLERTCALKENLENTGELSRQFEREARILANLNHPNLPRVTDHFNIPDQGQYLVMDFVEGDDLEERLARNGGPLAVGTVLGWVDQVCDALSYLHKHDPPIIHRDIKPANIRITPQGRAVLVDFGIAKFYNPQLQTTVGARAVTSGYSPPEQYGRGATDSRSDVYALGATLYAALTDITPPDSVDLMSGNAGPLRPARSINPAVPEAVSQAIVQAMKLAREQRFASMDAFRSALHSPPAGPAPVQPSPLVARTAVVEQPRRPVSNPPEPAPRPPSGPAQVFIPLGPSADRPRSKPRTGPKTAAPGRTLAFMAAAGLLVAFLGLAAAVYVLSVIIPDGKVTPGGIVTPGSTGGDTGGVLVTEVTQLTDTPAVPASRTPTDVPPPTDTPLRPTPVGAVLASLPESRLAFVSDHGSDGTDQIWVYDLAGGDYLFAPSGGGAFQIDGQNGLPAPDAPVAVPLGAGTNIAWWPDWCSGSRTLLYEGQKTQDANYQAIYRTDFNGRDPGQPQIITWEGFAKIGVPRCAYRSNRAVASGLDDLRTNNWRLFSFSLDNPTAPELIGNGFAFSGFATWAGDDSWIMFMHSEGGQPFRTFWMTWSDPGNFHPAAMPEGMTTTRFPALSPSAGRVAFACPDSDGGRWGLCAQNPDGANFSRLRSSLGPISSEKRGAKSSFAAITPTWSPDGHWLAYSADKDGDGDWDIYLYNPELDIDYNLTQGLGGDQFHPAWSKP